ncbi:methyltransferase family protein [Nocardia tenerifensis]|uniref:Methyltransferase family protein n=1 Tax=Nocardia tenerifensis TaxID=228006 RepID=A0A318KF00_9NOCA|nr:class I SAM-dependent methyltransferase [Nocardia tenerifensis]PXX71399.1 methyltransferase family protein [Nocardia tenerifensis]
MSDTDHSTTLTWDTAAAAAAYRRRDMRLAERLIFPTALHHLGRPARPDAAVLDIGCGTGVLAALMARTHGWTVHGLDVSPHMLEIARTDNAHPRIDYHLFDGRSLPDIADGTVDAAVCCLVYCTDPDDHRLAALTSEIERVLRPGAPYILADLNPDATGEQFSTLRYGEPKTTYSDGDSVPVVLRRLDGTTDALTCHFRTLATYTSLLTDAGFPTPTVDLPTDTATIAPYMVLTTHKDR